MPDAFDECLESKNADLEEIYTISNRQSMERFE